MRAKQAGKRYSVAASVVLLVLAMGARRGAANAPTGRYTISSGGTATGTVLDTQTGLTWQQAAPAGATLASTWSSALSYCTSNAGALPGSGWRLPSMTELQSIVDDSRFNPSIDPNAFPSTPIALFWTSSTYVPAAGTTWCIDFDDGYTFLCTTASTTAAVRCVH